MKTKTINKYKIIIGESHRLGIKDIKGKAARFIITILLIDIAFVFLYPFIYSVVTSLKTEKDLNDITVNWIPSTLYFKNYVAAYELVRYPLRIKSTLIIVIFATIGHLFSGSLVGFSLARHNFKGSRLLFFMVILSIIIPAQTIIVPLYQTFTKMGLVDRYLALILPCFFGLGLRGGIFIFLFRQYYLTFPIELEEAARIDGCGGFRTFWNIVLPNSKASIIVSIILSMVWHWNDFYEPMAYLMDSNKYPITVPVNNLYWLFQTMERTGRGGADSAVQILQEVNFNQAIILAVIVIVIIPEIIIFLFLQKNFVEGIERTGITS